MCVDARFFRGFGLFVQDGFLDEDTLQRLSDEMRSSEAVPATVARSSSDDVDEGHRRSKWANVSDETLESVRERLVALRPALEAHFEQPLGECQKLQFLVYREGDFFRAHRDNSRNEKTSDYAREREVSVVTFVTGEGEEDGYDGGALEFFDLMQHEASGSKPGLPLSGEPGLLVAFDSTMVHGVTPVTRGERYTIVTWFTARPAETDAQAR